MTELNSRCVLAVDIGGTNVVIGLSDMKGEVFKEWTLPTSRLGKGRRVLNSLMRNIENELSDIGLSKEQIGCMGLAVPGIVTDSGRVKAAPALEWYDYPLEQHMSDLWDIPVLLENDVNAAAFGESIFGAGRDYKNYIFMAIGTAIGGGIVLDGRLYKGQDGAAGEIGYTIVNMNWLSEGSHINEFGCLESYAGARAILETGKKLVPENVVLSGAKDVFDLAKEGSAPLKRIVSNVIEVLAAAIINMSVILDPEAIIVGGGVSKAGESLIGPVRGYVEKVLPTHPHIVLSELGATAALRGVAHMAAQAAG